MKKIVIVLALISLLTFVSFASSKDTPKSSGVPSTVTELVGGIVGNGDGGIGGAAGPVAGGTTGMGGIDVKIAQY